MIRNISLLCVLLLMSSLANAADRGSLILSVGGLVQAGYDDVKTNEEEATAHYGAGALIEANVNRYFGIETGALYVDRVYKSELGSARLTQQVNRLHVPVLARFWAGDVFSVGIGPFAAFRVGDQKTTLNVGDTQVGTIKTSADDNVELGVEAVATLNFAVANKPKRGIARLHLSFTS